MDLKKNTNQNLTTNPESTASMVENEQEELAVVPPPEKIKAASEQLQTVTSQVEKQISAPSYFFSLSENSAPPFRKPPPEPRPKLLIGSIMNETEAIIMIAAADEDKGEGLKRFLGKFLVEKQVCPIYNLSERNYLILLLAEVIDYAAQRDFPASKLAVMITIYLSSHLYFKHFYWLPPAALWEYFHELMIRHTVEDSPDGEQVFEPEECYDLLTHFHTIYFTNLPLIHIRTFGVYRLKLLWPFKTQKK